MPIIIVPGESMTKSQITAALVALKAQLDSATAKILAKLAAGDSTPEEDKALADLQASVQALDDAAQ